MKLSQFVWCMYVWQPRATMSMLPHVKAVCKSAFYHLWNISRIRKLRSTKTAEILVHACLTSKLDYFNSLLYSVPKSVIKKLKSVQKAAARLITSSRKLDHTTPILFDLHWFPVSERIRFKTRRFCKSCNRALKLTCFILSSMCVGHAA